MLLDNNSTAVLVTTYLGSNLSVLVVWSKNPDHCVSNSLPPCGRHSSTTSDRPVLLVDVSGSCVRAVRDHVVQTYETVIGSNDLQVQEQPKLTLWNNRTSLKLTPKEQPHRSSIRVSSQKEYGDKASVQHNGRQQRHTNSRTGARHDVDNLCSWEFTRAAGLKSVWYRLHSCLVSETLLCPAQSNPWPVSHDHKSINSILKAATNYKRSQAHYDSSQSQTGRPCLKKTNSCCLLPL